jgi:hypothetical protein
VREFGAPAAAFGLAGHGGPTFRAELLHPQSIARQNEKVEGLEGRERVVTREGDTIVSKTAGREEWLEADFRAMLRFAQHDGLVEKCFG